ncbi:MAG: ribonuclease activity regulator RraA [Proteobacteria bacterium]|nr:ribonuclease activity regulator RraA [Pseudomonadota bacterium]MBI3495688.1 ribonuclease activity regulator RraA [Pseudomonadota bacterium]
MTAKTATAVRLSEETKRLFLKSSSATLTTQLFKRGLRNTFLTGLRPVNPKACRFVGEAYTLRYIPAREDLDHLGVFEDRQHPQRKAIEDIPPGHVLVMDCRGDMRAASAGSILITRLMRRGAAAVVSDGGLRDTPTIAELDIPVFCRGPSAPTNLIHHHAVDINQPIACANVAVFPGDVLVGDGEGVVVVPRHLASEVAADAAEQERFEDFVTEKVLEGRPIFGLYPADAETKAEYQRWKPKS